MTGKENYLNALRHLPTEWVPVEGEDLLYTGFEFNSMEMCIRDRAQKRNW